MTTRVPGALATDTVSVRCPLISDATSAPEPAAAEPAEPAEPAESTAPARSRRRAALVRAGRAVFAVAILAVLVQVAIDNWSDLRDVDLTLRVGWLLAAAPIGVVAGLVLPLAWARLVAAYGTRLSPRVAVRVWCLSQAGRYLPTGVPGMAARVVLAQRAGVPRSLGVASLAVELGLLVTWSSLAAAVALPSSVLAWPLRLALGLAAAGALVGLPWLLRVGGRLLPRVPALAPQAQDRRELAAAIATYGLNAVLKAARFVFVALAVLPDVDGGDVAVLVGSEAVGVVAGLIGVTPAGIGVREAVTAGALRDRFGFAPAFALSVVVRAFDFAVELLWLGVALALRRQEPAAGTPVVTR